MNQPGATLPDQPPRVIHLRFESGFVASAQPGERIYREFTQPCSKAAVLLDADLCALTNDKPWPEPTDELYIVSTTLPVDGTVGSSIDRWLAAPDHPGALPPLKIEAGASIIRWRPGRVAVEGQQHSFETLMPVLVEFCFLKGELRRLEQNLMPIEDSAPADVKFAYQIRRADRGHWRRLADTPHCVALMRLEFARLEARLRNVPPSLTPPPGNC